MVAVGRLLAEQRGRHGVFSSAPLPAEYYRDAYERLHNLVFWLFMGSCPYEDPSAFERTLPGDRGA